MTYHAELIAVGEELLSGGIANSDTQFLSRALTAAGVKVLFHTAVGDSAERIQKAADIARRRADLLIFIGGLGPTADDVTKTAVARTFRRELVFHPEITEEIRHYFDTVFHRPMPQCNLQQAYLPEGCEIFHNPVGTAPGCCFEEGGVTVMLLPGVPYECRYMTDHCVLPYLRRRGGGVALTRDVRTFGLTEPQVQELLGDLIRTDSNPSVAPYALTGEVAVRLTAAGADQAACEKRMQPVLKEIRTRLGNYIYGEDVCGLEEAVVHLLAEKHLTCAAAESCTGGLIAKRLTDVPGASAVFLGGVVSYTNGVKAGVLGVDPALLEQYGAVSEPVAKAMAEGARRITGADLAISVTGVAGPDRDDRGNEIGTVYVGLSAPEGTVVRLLALGRGRGYIRTLAAHHALDLIRRYAAGDDINSLSI